MKNFSDIRSNDNDESAFEIHESIRAIRSAMDLFEDEVVLERLAEMIEDLEVIETYNEVVAEALDEENYTDFKNNLLECVATCVRENTDTEVTLVSGEIVCITPELAQAIANTYDSLNEANGNLFIETMCESMEEFDEMLEFVEKTEGI